MPDLKIMAKELEALQNILNDKMLLHKAAQLEFQKANDDVVAKVTELNAARMEAAADQHRETPPPAAQE